MRHMSHGLIYESYMRLIREQCTRGGGARVRQLEGVEQDLDLIRFVFNTEMDEVARDACVACGAVMPT